MVLNAIDDTLDKGKTGDLHWTVEEITYLRPSSTRPAAPAARSYSPLITATSSTWGGHVSAPAEKLATGLVLQGQARSPSAAPASSSAGRGEVVAAVDEAIHYTPKRAGYHGGASPAEVVISVITLLPSDSLLPSGWWVYDHEAMPPRGGMHRGAQRGTGAEPRQETQADRCTPQASRGPSPRLPKSVHCRRGRGRTSLGSARRWLPRG